VLAAKKSGELGASETVTLAVWERQGIGGALFRSADHHRGDQGSHALLEQLELEDEAGPRSFSTGAAAWGASSEAGAPAIAQRGAASEPARAKAGVAENVLVQV
jgi:hypothetical protein